ncbi:MAG: hypothetical protein HC852_13060 [Acaryochloridaceae cyanobacterium RU_4_10]|nr:hypothetical protein [Acaryochloridaceae cyanobacterium RU_4_10]
MFREDQIQHQFGTKVLNYVKNKHRGGTNSEKGNTYENFFAVFQLAFLAPQIIEFNDEIFLASQILAFVDDLIIDRQQTEMPLKHFQLKNSTRVSWGQGLRSIADDFRKQYQLNLQINRQSDLSLVVSDPKLKSSLELSQPADLKAFCQVQFFPYAQTLAKVIQQHEPLQRAIKYLCAFENPAPDKIECAANVLLGAWVASDKSNISAIEILRKAQEASPSYIRTFSSQWRIDLDVKQILDSIDNFSYNLAKGFFHWQFGNGLEEGTLSYNCETERFKQFEALIKREKPTSYEDLEVFLI